jgi:hypothetical protein
LKGNDLFINDTLELKLFIGIWQTERNELHHQATEIESQVSKQDEILTAQVFSIIKKLKKSIYKYIKFMKQRRGML